MRGLVMRAMDTESLDEKTSMYINIYCHGTVALTCDWMLGRFAATEEALAEVFESSLPGPLHRYLLEQ